MCMLNERHTPTSQALTAGYHHPSSQNKIQKPSKPPSSLIDSRSDRLARLGHQNGNGWMMIFHLSVLTSRGFVAFVLRASVLHERRTEGEVQEELAWLEERRRGGRAGGRGGGGGRRRDGKK